ncbi:MAG: P-loop NTPase [Bacteriovoracaceae bacterium]|nr:P-loop NTPase [Bacteriovoracaceae bacterium]
MKNLSNILLNKIGDEISPLTAGPQASHQARLWSIGGGKGGVGKSLVTANVSISLALMGYKVLAVDLDLGGANLHTCLGLPIPEKTLSDFVTKKVKTINELILPSSIKNLSVISGAQDELGMANLKQVHKNEILNALSQVDADIVLMDLGAGTNANTLDFYINSQKGILVVLPEPTSIENAYRFIKSVYFRRLKMIEDLLDIQPLINQASNAKINSGNTPTDLIRKVYDLNPEMGTKLKTEILKFQPQLIINQVRSQTDIDIGFSIKSICKRYFGIEVDYVGYLDYDASVWQSVKKRRPLLLEFPNSRLVTNFDKIVNRLLENT